MRQRARNCGKPDAAIAIVMPCFNSARTIESAIASIRAQTFGDWELVVIDDGSTDGSDVLVRELAAHDCRIRIVCQRNSGPAVARNRGVQITTAQFVAFLDSDDAWDPDHLALHAANLQADASLGISVRR